MNVQFLLVKAGGGILKFIEFLIIISIIFSLMSYLILLMIVALAKLFGNKSVNKKRTLSLIRWIMFLMVPISMFVINLFNF